MVDKLYPTIELIHVQVLDLSRALLWIQHFICNHATPQQSTIDKLQSKGTAMHAYGVSAGID